MRKEWKEKYEAACNIIYKEGSHFDGFFYTRSFILLSGKTGQRVSWIFFLQYGNDYYSVLPDGSGGRSWKPGGIPVSGGNASGTNPVSEGNYASAGVFMFFWKYVYYQ